MFSNVEIRTDDDKDNDNDQYHHVILSIGFRASIHLGMHLWIGWASHPSPSTFQAWNV
jgi:hypothetical protein